MARGDEELRQGKTASLDKTLQRLEVTQEELSGAVIEVNVPIKVLVKGWEPAERLDLLGRPDAVQIHIWTALAESPLLQQWNDYRSALDEDVQFSLEKLDEDRTRIAAFVAPHHASFRVLGRSKYTTRKLQADLDRLKSSLEADFEPR